MKFKVTFKKESKPALRNKIIIAFLGLGLLGWACARGPFLGKFASPVSDPKEVLVSIGTHVILPGYTRLWQAATSLEVSLSNLCGGPDPAKLINAQDAWKNAHGLLRMTEAFAFGPYKTQLFREKIDFRPTQTDKIEMAIADHGSFPSELIDQLGNGIRGLPALEYLLFDPNGNSQKIIDLLTTDPHAGNRCAFLVALGSDLVTQTQELLMAWDPSGGNFYGQFSQPGSAGSSFSSTHEVLGILLNQLGELIEILKDLRLGVPLGLKSGGVPQPESVLNPYSHHTTAALLKNLEGFESVYLGKWEGAGAPGLYDYVFGLDQYEAEEVLERLAETVEAIQKIPEPLGETVVSHPELVEAAFERAMELRDLLLGPLASLVGVNPSFADSDND